MPVSRQAFVAGAASAFAGISVVGRAHAAEFELKYGHDLAPDHPLNVRSVEAFARIKAATNGRVQIRAFPNSQLGGDPAMLQQLRTGATEMLALPGAFLNSVVPVASIENVAYAFPNREAAFHAMDGELGAVIRSEIAAKGMVCMEKIWENGFRELTTATKPIRNAGDLAGLKIRVSPGNIRFDTFKSLGAAPTPISINELYSALQTHIVDAQENPLLLIEVQKFYEVQKYVSMSNHMWSGYWTLVNEDVWKRFPPDIQKIVARELNGAALRARADNANLSTALRDKLQRRGMIFNEVDVSSFKAKLVGAGYYERWKNEFGPKAWAALERYANRLA